MDLGKGPVVAGGPPVALGDFQGISNGYTFEYNPSSGALTFPPVAPFDLLYETYDTGTSEYNRDTANDSGANGVDNDGDGVVDEMNEQDAVAPYNVPIRGLKFTMRVTEPNTKQVRQLTVMKSYSGQ